MNKGEAKWIYQKMNDIRAFENQVHKTFSEGKIPGFVHLYAGEEAVATGVMVQLEDDDYIASTHRGHGHAIAKGCDMNRMMAEVLGRKDGLGGGKGGSMHVADIDKGMLGANGIVGGGIGLANGASMSIRNLKKDNVAISFFGDGAANEGSFHEGLNLASILNLPVVFVCENNQYAEGTAHQYASATETIAERASAYDMPGAFVDGANPEEVHDTMKKAIKRAKDGKGPTLIECSTYRNYGHFEGDEQKYKSKDDKNANRDPIPEFRQKAIDQNWLTKDEADQMEQDAKQKVADALEYAENSPIPDIDAMYEDVFA